MKGQGWKKRELSGAKVRIRLSGPHFANGSGATEAEGSDGEPV
jgi:hypothetical protein